MTRAHSGRDEDDLIAKDSQYEPAPKAHSPEILEMDCHLIQMNWTKEHFEKFRCTIIGFSNNFMHENQVNGLSVTRDSVVVYWLLLVWSLYGEGNATCTVLEAQVSSCFTWDRMTFED